MKLYFNNIEFSNVEFKHKKQRITIYSDEGIYYFNHNKLYKKGILYNSYKYEYKDYDIIVDDSVKRKDNECFYLPMNSIEVEETYYEYVINNNIRFIKKQYHKTTEYYFVINKLNDTNIKRIISFILKYNIKVNNYD